MKRYWQSLIAVLAGNAIYFSTERFLPERAQTSALPDRLGAGRRFLDLSALLRGAAADALSFIEDGRKWENAEVRVEVFCYSGYKGDERPLRFRLGDRDYSVDDLLDRWYGPHDIFFKMRANDGNLYILRRRSDTPEGEWSLESFRNSRPGL